MQKAIVFDLGGVIEKINPGCVIENFRALGMQDADNFFSLLKQSPVCSAFEKGELKEDGFIKYLKSKCAKGTAESQIKKAWCANQEGITMQTLSTLCSLKKQNFQLFLLSNTNPIHAQTLEKSFLLQHKMQLGSLFDGRYYSYLMQLRKPDPAIFQTVLEANSLSATECIYVDDIEENVQIAKKLGFISIYHKTNSEVEEETLRNCCEL